MEGTGVEGDGLREPEVTGGGMASQFLTATACV